MARVYDYFLGGAHHFPADRDAAAKVERTWPQIRDTARVNRLFLEEAVRYLAGKFGIRRFLGIGSGMPTMGNVHEVGVLLPRWEQDREHGRTTTVEGRLPVYAGVGRVR